jgi:hypothetical protein
MSRIISYRGKLAGNDAGSSELITLHTNDGKTGYRIKKLQTIQKSPGALDCEGLVVIWKTEPTAAEIATKTIDLSNNRILAVAFYSAQATANTYPEDMTIIFDSEKFNQDIYISYIDVRTVNDSMNYYIELEQIPLTEDQALVAIVKNLRNEQ